MAQIAHDEQLQQEVHDVVKELSDKRAKARQAELAARAEKKGGIERERSEKKKQQEARTDHLDAMHKQRDRIKAVEKKQAAEQAAAFLVSESLPAQIKRFLLQRHIDRPAQEVKALRLPARGKILEHPASNLWSADEVMDLIEVVQYCQARTIWDRHTIFQACEDSILSMRLIMLAVAHSQYSSVDAPLVLRWCDYAQIPFQTQGF